jgi:hypothetical protein
MSNFHFQDLLHDVGVKFDPKIVLAIAKSKY